MKHFSGNIRDLTLKNTDYRHVIYTAQGLQLVVMNILPGVEIGEEVHDLDQFIRVEQGSGKVILNGSTHYIHENDAVVIPRGTKHNVINHDTKNLKIYSIYGPPEHKHGTIQPKKEDEKEEHFDGRTS